MMRVVVTASRGERRKSFEAFSRDLATLPERLGPAILARMQNMVLDLFIYQGELPGTMYENSWEPLSQRTVTKRRRLGYWDSNLILVRTGEFRKHVVESGSIIKQGQRVVVSIAPTDFRYPILSAGSEARGLPERPMVPVGPAGEEVVRELIGEQTIIPFFEAELEGLDHAGLSV